MTWITAIGLFFNIGQAIRWYSHQSQLDTIDRELQAQYVSVLGENVGTSPFGRLQFLHGQIAAQEQFGLDPLALMAAFSRHADFMVRVDGMNLNGEVGTLTGTFMPDKAGFSEFVKRLDADEEYDFLLKGREETLGGIQFTLEMRRK